MSRQFIYLLLVIFSTSSFSMYPAYSKVSRLRVFPKTLKEKIYGPTENKDENLEIFYFNQNLDHFTYTPKSYSTFRQRYAVNSKHWGGSKSNAPILVFFGGETSMEYDMSVNGFLHDNAPHFKALLVNIEHRYYGKSLPFGNAKEAMKNTSTLGYLTAAQALADYAAILLHIKDKYSAKHCPIIVIGASYGGMLAAWFRLKYPHIAIGALASSAPILYFQDTLPKYGYYYIITKVIKETSESCYKTIRKSWDEIDKIAAKPDGLSFLSKKFRTCTRLNDSFSIKDYLDSMYSEIVQYSDYWNYWVTSLCNAINKNPPNHKYDILDRIFAGVIAIFGNQSCYDMDSFARSSDNAIAWGWQACSEIVMPIGYDKEDTMFQTAPFNMSKFIDECESDYGVRPRPHWITTYFGIQDVKLVLKQFGSNIIFSNGLLDPYSVGGVLEDISDTVVAITTKYGSHGVDIQLKSKDDPEWLQMQREKEIKIIDYWIITYQKDLREFKI